MTMAQHNSTMRDWMAVVALAVGAFIVVTTELAPIGMLSGIADNFSQSPGRTGLVVTAYAWIGAVAALFSVLAISGLRRRPLMVSLMLLLALSNAIAAASSTFNMLLMARLFGALAHGAFWTMVGTLGAQLVSTRQVGRATAIIFGGVSAASVIGVPLVNLISNHGGWRVGFTCLAVLSLLTGLALAALLPRIPGSEPLNRSVFKVVLSNKQLRRLYAIAALVIVAHFAAFTFVEVLLSSRLNVSASSIAICLFAFGAAGIAGNFLCGALIDRHPKYLLGSALLLMSLCLIVIGSGIAGGTTVATILVFGWGMGIAMVFVSIQTSVLRVAGDAALPASAIYVAIFNGAIGTGAFVGAGILDNWGVGLLCTGAAALSLISLAVVPRLQVTSVGGASGAANGMHKAESALEKQA